MATIDTLIPDVYAVLTGEKSPSDIVDNVTSNAEFAKRVLTHIHADLVPDSRTDRDPMEFYVTQFSNPCWRKAWLDKHKPDAVRERAFSGHTKFKFLYGDLIEESFLYLAQAAGHEVTDTQRRYSIPMGKGGYKLAGRIDAIIDGWLVDVKSSDPYTFERIVKGGYEDKFGYENQLRAYRAMMDKGTVKGIANIFINKVNGKMHVLKWSDKEFSDERTYNAIHDFAGTMSGKHAPPIVLSEAVDADGSLTTMCSYCPFKFDCFPFLKVYAYSTGPTFVVNDKTKRKVTEITEAYKKQADVR